MADLIQSPGVRTVKIKFDVDGKEYEAPMRMNWALVRHNDTIDLTVLQNKIRHGDSVGPEKRIVVPAS